MLSRNGITICFGIALLVQFNLAHQTAADSYSTRVDAFPSPVVSSKQTSRDWFASLPVKERLFIQLHLILTGHYNGFADGLFGSNTYQALLDFERSIDARPDGILSRAEKDRLLEKSSAVFGVLGFEKTYDEETGLSLFVPLTIAGSRSETKRGSAWRSTDGKFALETVLVPESDIPYYDLYSRLIAETRTRRVTYSTIKKGYFVVSGISNGRKFYLKMDRLPNRSVGFSMSWAPEIDVVGGRISVFLASLAAVRDAGTGDFEGANQSPITSGKRSERDISGKTELSSGSGFFISKSGLIVTNSHVVKDCDSIKVPGFGTGSVLTLDEDADLAAVIVKGVSNPPTAVLANARPQLGQQVLVVGFPLADLLGSSLVFSEGIVSGETGIGGSKQHYSISAPIQPGNSGGPVLDIHGNVIGVAVGKLNELVMLEHKGTSGSNIAFVIAPEVLGQFVKPFDKRFAPSGASEVSLSTEEIAARAKKFTVQVICRREN